MKVLLNLSPAESGYQKAMDYLLSRAGHTALYTTKVMTPDYASDLAKKIGASAILLCNPESLKNFVDDPKCTLDKWRGSRLDTAVPTIVLDSLANMYAKYEGKFIMEKDLGKLSYIHIPKQKFKYTVLRNPAQFPEWLAKAKQAMAIGCDIETNQHSVRVGSKYVPVWDVETLDIKGLGETWITCLAFCVMDQQGKLDTCVLPLVNGQQDYWAADSDYAAAITFMQDMMATDAPKCFHNGLYDAFHLCRYRAFPNNWILDTLGLSWSWYSELDKDLGFLASWTLYDAEYWKHLADADHKVKGNIEDYWKYNALDTWRMMRILKELLIKGDHWMFSNYKMQFPLVYPSTYGAFEGMLINNNTRKAKLAEAQKKVAELKTKLQVMTDNPDFNPSSPQQNSEFLYNVLGAARPPRSKSKAATGKKERRTVGAQHPLIAMFVDTLDKYAYDAKAISTYYQFRQFDSRLLWSLNPFGTETSRFASRSSHMWIGTQIQNQPYYAKDMYEPDPGYLLFEIDYSKAEAICTAYLAQCAALIRALCFPELDKNGKKKDFYKVLGVMFFNMVYEEVTQNFRDKVLKKIQHGTNYMMGGATFLDNLEDISVIYLAAEVLGFVITANPVAPNEMTAEQFAKRLLDSYHGPFPEVSAWWERIRDEVASTHMLINPHGLVRYFFGDASKNHAVWRSAVAHLPQSTSVGNLNKGYLRAYEYAASLPDRSILRPKTQIHDSLLGQVKIEYAAEIIPKLAGILEARQIIHGQEMIIPVEVDVSHTNWKDKKKWMDFLETTLPTLGSQKSLTSLTVG